MAHERIRSLSTLTSGQKGTIAALSGERIVQKRMAGMGLYIGCDIEVLQCGDAGSPWMIASGETRLALGQEIVSKILVALSETASTRHSFFRLNFQKLGLKPFWRGMRSM